MSKHWVLFFADKEDETLAYMAQERDVDGKLKHTQFPLQAMQFDSARAAYDFAAAHAAAFDPPKHVQLRRARNLLDWRAGMR